MVGGHSPLTPSRIYIGTHKMAQAKACQTGGAVARQATRKSGFVIRWTDLLRASFPSLPLGSCSVFEANRTTTTKAFRTNNASSNRAVAIFVRAVLIIIKIKLVKC